MDIIIRKIEKELKIPMKNLNIAIKIQLSFLQKSLYGALNLLIKYA